ncbi:MAG: VCBS repeat-containing protein [Verrucomicrobia bacterium]|nr:VCBS repeat-containing protein [Verrucomicrobiota bacterium]
MRCSIYLAAFGTGIKLFALVMKTPPLLLRLFAGCVLTACAASAATTNSPAQRFGFVGPEVFPVDYQIAHLHAADFDGDGLNDLLVVNNARSKITILYNRTGKPAAPKAVPPTARRDVNELPPDARFRIDSIASEKRITSLVVADLNGDGRPDLAYYGEPKELLIQLNLGKGTWAAPRRIAIDDAQLTQNALVTGDLNGDKLTDLILLAETHIWVLYQKPDHTFAEPEKIPFTGNVKAVQVLDIDGDGRDDLLLVNWEDKNPFRFRLQNAAGRLGSEVHFPFPQIRSFWAEDLDGDRKMELLTIAMQSGRAQVSNFIQKPAEPFVGALKQGQLQILPLNRTDKARRGTVWADVNGDGLTDLLVAEPDSGQLSVYLQQKDGTLGPAKKFPTLTGVTELAVADWDGDGQTEVFVLSADERQLGVSKIEANGRIAFPKTVALEGRPLAMTVGALVPGAKPTLAVIVDNDGKRSLVTQQAGAPARTQKLAESFKSNPSALFLHDADQDGTPDLVVLTPYEKIKVLLGVAGKDFIEVDVTPPGGTMEQPWFSLADVDGDGKAELLLPQKNFLRAVVLQHDSKSGDAKPTGSFVVKDQINGAASNSRLVGAASLANGGKSPLLFLLDAERKQLSVAERDAAGVWQIARSLPLPVADFTGLRAVALGTKEPNALALLGLNSAAWLAFSGQVWEIRELDGYETPIKDGRLTDVVTGDLNQDGRKDLVFLETAKNHLDIVTFEKGSKLVPANRWQVFEERTFRNRRSDAPEPREALIADVTGDGKNDLIILVHDRILVYPQE